MLLFRNVNVNVYVWRAWVRVPQPSRSIKFGFSFLNCWMAGLFRVARYVINQYAVHVVWYIAEPLFHLEIIISYTSIIGV